MNHLQDFAISISHEAGAFLKKRFGGKQVVDFKGAINLVTESDRMSEEILKTRIHREFPHHGILAEESPEIDSRSGYRWIIDPLDGTTNYAHGYPVYCVSIALEQKGEVLLGVVYNPMLEETFTAVQGQGAFLNGERISVSRTDKLSGSLLATGFPYDIRETSDNNLNYFIAMVMRAQAIRRAGSAALDLAYLASGRFDGFWELRLKPWDTAAATLMVREAGGTVSDLAGKSHLLESASVLASNGLVHREMVEVLSGTNPDFDRVTK